MQPFLLSGRVAHQGGRSLPGIEPKFANAATASIQHDFARADSGWMNLQQVPRQPRLHACSACSQGAMLPATAKLPAFTSACALSLRSAAVNASVTAAPCSSKAPGGSPHTCSVQQRHFFTSAWLRSALCKIKEEARDPWLSMPQSAQRCSFICFRLSWGVSVISSVAASSLPPPRFWLPRPPCSHECPDFTWDCLR